MHSPRTLARLLASINSLAICGSCFAAFTAYAGNEGVGKDDAVALVKKGVAFIKAHGADKGYAEVTYKQGQFNQHGLYLSVYAMDGTVKAHGANEKLVGRNLIDLKDIDGKPFVRERIALAKAQSNFWQDYKFTNPTTKKIEPKRAYCERLDDTVVCGGIYAYK